VVLALGARADRGFSLRALIWTVIAGLGGAGFVLCDSNGVRATESAISYGLVLAVSNALVMSWRQRHVGSPMTIIKRNWKAGLPCAVAAMVSYLLIIWVWKNAPVAPAAALRDTSAVFAIIIAVVWLRETITRARLAAVLLAAAAVPLIRLG
jgi:drug/metabolite transporter (DMT)-like permease